MILEGKACKSLVIPSQVFNDRNLQFDEDNFHEVLAAHWKDLAVLVHEKGIDTEDWLAFFAASDLPCDIRREGGQFRVTLEGKEGNPL